MKTRIFRRNRVFSRAQQIWAELDYVQRRVFELQTGIPSVSRHDPRIARRVDDLESLYSRRAQR